MDDETALYHKQRGVTGLPMFAPVARDSDPVTSHAGHDKVTKSGTRQTHAQIALQCFKAHGPLIANDVKRITGIDGIWKRVSDLKNAGLIRPTGVTRDGQDEFEAVPETAT